MPLIPALLALVLACAPQDPPAHEQGAPRGPDTLAREVAVTVDDLPVVSPVRRDLAHQRRVTAGLLAGLREHGVPAVGFVNEDKLLRGGEVDPERVELLRAWVRAGLELGNHTFSHPDLHRVPLEPFQEEVLRGEKVTRRVLAEDGREPRWFRHPYLHTGRDPETKRGLESFLAAHGYRVAPVTIDNYDYVFANAYDRAEGDSALRERIRREYVDYMDDVFAYHEAQSVAFLGRDMRHVLLLHANALNADAFDALAERIEGRGYRFIPLERALEDPAYGMKDDYTGPAGITWLHRWALTVGKRGEFFAGEPEVPAWVREAAEAP